MDSDQPQLKQTAPGPSWSKLVVTFLVLIIIGIGHKILVEKYNPDTLDTIEHYIFSTYIENDKKFVVVDKIDNKDAALKTFELANNTVIESLNNGSPNYGIKTEIPFNVFQNYISVSQINPSYNTIPWVLEFDLRGKVSKITEQYVP